MKKTELAGAVVSVKPALSGGYERMSPLGNAIPNPIYIENFRILLFSMDKDEFKRCLQAARKNPCKSIAESRIRCLPPKGKPFTIHVQIGQPVKVDKAVWACPVDMKPLYKRLGPICGEDSLQSICLALRLIKDLLRDAQKKGNQLRIPRTKHAFPLEAYFGEQKPPS